MLSVVGLVQEMETELAAEVEPAVVAVAKAQTGAVAGYTDSAGMGTNTETETMAEEETEMETEEMKAGVAAVVAVEVARTKKGSSWKKMTRRRMSTALDGTSFSACFADKVS